ncbi:MAG: signal peptidase II [Candidatus Bipolaricaulota bacterium]|nr:signal peptidase II [Candidatus Bipolaricaulota bacterium]
MRFVRSLLCAAAVLAFDQGAKLWAAQGLVLGEVRPLWGDFLRLTRVHNTGGAFGLLPRHTGALIAVSCAVVLALGAVLVWGSWRRMGRVGSALLLGGAVGNLVDRVRWGYVLDFFEIRGFPVFNVADAAIVIGAGLVALSFLVGGRAQ